MAMIRYASAILLSSGACLCWVGPTPSFGPTTRRPAVDTERAAVVDLPAAIPGRFGATLEDGALATMKLKAQVLQLGASLDRGQMYNPTSGPQYSERLTAAVGKIEELVALTPPLPTTLGPLEGEWELVLSSVPHGIFRSSPFFLAVQEALNAGEGKEGPFESIDDKANL